MAHGKNPMATLRYRYATLRATRYALRYALRATRYALRYALRATLRYALEIYTLRGYDTLRYALRIRGATRRDAPLRGAALRWNRY